ncbi:hypothetical protein ABZZ36_37295 [Actinacidiphila glaucinigra]|uniref:hypothetical protein n=1 Tax=Actinacidiphila glaucinigra TaxID=235986 RepID=UPI0033A10076
MTSTWSPRIPVRSTTNWPYVIAAIPTVAALVFFALLAYAWVFAHALKPHSVDCAETEPFFGGSMPPGATEVVCTNTRGFMDQAYDADFRLPRERLADRLTAAFPRLRVSQSCKADLCLHNRPDEQRNDELSSYMEVTVTYQRDDTALIHIAAYNV